MSSCQTKGSSHEAWHAEKIKAEVMKQFDAGFLAVTSYSQWVANVVPVPKKDRKVRMCVDYRDLNKASPKDDFSLPHIDMLVDSTSKFKVFSFMDGFSGYNQIRMAREEMEKQRLSYPGEHSLQSDALQVEER